MKKILGAFIAFLMVFALTTVSAPAQAEEFNRASCTALVQKESLQTLTIAKDAGGLRTASWGSDGHIAFATRVNFRRCNGGRAVYIESMNLVANPDFTGCAGGYVQNFKIDPNGLGNWNPAERTFNCTGASRYEMVIQSSVTNQYAFASDSAARRCFSSFNQISLDSDFDQSGQSPNVCLV